MGTFVSGDTALPADRTNGPGQGPADQTYEVDADYMNGVWDAASDLRDQTFGWVNPSSTAYGATFDGSTNDAPALALAVADAITKGLGVLIPARMFLSSGTLNIRCPMLFVGNGAFDVQPGCVLTVTGSFTASTPHQIFYLNGGTFTLATPLDKIQTAWFGDIGDNINNDAVAINQAITVAQAIPVVSQISARPEIIIGPGIHKCIGSVTVTSSNVTVRGAGPRQTVLSFTANSPNTDGFVWGAFASPYTDYLFCPTMSGIQIKATSANIRHVFRANAPGQASFSDMEIHGSNLATGHGVNIDFGINTTLRRILIGDCLLGDAIHVVSGTATTTTAIYDCYTTSCLNGYGGGGGTGLRFYGVIFESHTGYGISLGEGGTDNSPAWLFGCHFENNRTGTIKAGGNASGTADISAFGTTFLPINGSVGSMPASYYVIDLGNGTFTDAGGNYFGGIPAAIATGRMFRVNRGGTTVTSDVVLSQDAGIDSATGDWSVANDGTISPFRVPARGVERYIAATGASFTPTPSRVQVYYYTANGAATINAPAGAITSYPRGSRMRFYCIQDGTGSRQFTFNATYDVPSLAPGGANTRAVVDVESDGVKWRLIGGRPDQALTTAHVDIPKILRLTSGTPWAVTDSNGDIQLNNGTTDAPGVVFCTGTNQNMGIDARNADGLRVIVDIEEGGGVVAALFSRSSPGRLDLATLVASGAISGASAAITNAMSSGTAAVTGALTAGSVLANAGGSIATAGPVIAGYLREGEQLVTFSATPAFDSSLGGIMRITMTGNITGWTLAAGAAGQRATLLFEQDGTGSRTLAGTPANVRLAGGALTLSTGVTKIDAISLVYNFGLARWIETGRSLNT